MAEKYDLEHVSEGVGDQRHIIVRKKILMKPVEESQIVRPSESIVEQLNEEFRSFSVLTNDDEKKSTKKGVLDKPKPINISPEPILSPTCEAEEKVIDFFFFYFTTN